MIRTLLVEDSVPMQVALGDLLETIGFTVTQTVTREATAALWLQENPTAWDVAIVDLMLDDGSGFSIIRWCKIVHPAGHVIVFSAFSTEILREKCISLGADAVFTKASIQELVVHLERLAAAGNRRT